MKLFTEILLGAVLCGAVLGLVFFMKGRLVTPVKPGEGVGLRMVVSVFGDAAALEQTIRGLVWLQNSGRLEMEILILDEGLTPEGQKLLQNMAKQYRSIKIYSTVP